MAALQRAVFAALSGDAGLGSLLGGAKVFDGVPAGTVMPYVSFGRAEAFDWSTASEGGTEVLFSLHVWSGATRFALVKSYGTGADAYRRPVRKPVAGTLVVAVAGAAKPAAAFSFDNATGEVVFASGHVPASGAPVTAGYEFDVPVRFDTERLEVSLTAFKAGQIPAVPLVEVSP